MKLIFIILFFISFNCNAQKLSWNTFYDSINSETITNKQLEKLLKLEFKDFDTREIVRRPLIGQFYQKQLAVNVYKTNSLVFVNVINWRKEIVFIEVKYEDSRKPDVKIQKDKFDDLIKLHNQKFKIESDINDSLFNKVQYSVLGFGCYSTGEHSVEFDAINQLVQEQNLTKIRTWCYSLSQEVRCVGAIGLFGYQQKGDVLSDSDLMLLDKILNQKGLLFGCDGCDSSGFMYTTREVYLRAIEYLNYK